MSIKSTLIIFIALVAGCNGQNGIKWLNPKTDNILSVYGLAWFEQNNHEFIRLPLSEKENIPTVVWSKSLCPSSARVRFKTDSTSLRLKINHGMNTFYGGYNMSPISHSGIDLYLGLPSQMSFWKTTKPLRANEEYEHIYYEKLSHQMRELTLYLPSYAELADLKIGIDSDAKIVKATEYKYNKPIVFYGSSITQSGCASRGSNGFVPIISRKLDCDVINLGFSGSGKGEPVIAQIISQIDASIYVVDCVANMNTKLMNERYEDFVRILRKNKPEMPIVLMTKIHYARELDPKEAAEYKLQNKPVFETYNKLETEGDKNIYLFDSGAIIKTGGEHPTVDGVHLTDRGFYMLADKLAPLLEQILDSK